MGNNSALFLWALSFSLHLKVSEVFYGRVRCLFFSLTGKFLILSKKSLLFFYPLNVYFLIQCCKPVMGLQFCLWCLVFSSWQVGLCWRYATSEQRVTSRLTWPTTREVLHGWPLRYLKASMSAVISRTECSSWVFLCTRFPSLKKQSHSLEAELYSQSYKYRRMTQPRHLSERRPPLGTAGILQPWSLLTRWPDLWKKYVNQPGECWLISWERSTQ